MWPLVWDSLVSRDAAVLGQEQSLVSMFSIQTICTQISLALLVNFFFWIVSPNPLGREWASSCVVLICPAGLNHISWSCAVGKSSWLDCLFYCSAMPGVEFRTSWICSLYPFWKMTEDFPEKEKERCSKSWAACNEANPTFILRGTSIFYA